MEQLVILVIIGLISLVNWLMQKSAEKREAAKALREAAEEAGEVPRRMVRPQPPPSVRRAPERDPMRELMEALGLPPDALPPPVQHRREPAPTPAREEEEFSSLEEETPPPLPRSARQEPSWKQPPAPRRLDEKESRLASAFAASQSRPAADLPARPRHLRELLATRASQRDAVVLAEILGTPRALLPAGRWAGNLDR